MRLLWSLALVGCGTASPADGDTSPTTVDTGPVLCTDLELVVEIGTGDQAFVPLADGGEVVIVHGPQGGWHVDVSVKVDNTHQTVAIRPSITVDATGEAIAGDQQTFYVGLADFDGCSGVIWGQRAFVDDHPGTDETFICSLAGESATLAVEVTDPATERTVVAEKAVRLTVDPTESCP